METNIITSFAEVGEGQADETMSCETAHKADRVLEKTADTESNIGVALNKTADTESNIEMQAGTLQHKDKDFYQGSELQHDLENPKIRSELLTDIKGQALNDTVDQKKLSEAVNVRPESVLASKDVGIKGSTEASQSQTETNKILGHSDCTRQDEESNPKEDSDQTFESATASGSTRESEVEAIERNSIETSQNSTFFDQAKEKKHCSRQDEDEDEVEAIKIKDSTKTSPRPPDSDKVIEQKKQDEAEAIKQQDSTEISQNIPYHDKALEQKHSLNQYGVETTKNSNSVETPQRPLTADKDTEQKRQGEVETSKLEESSEASQTPPDADKATEEKHCSQQDEVEASNSELTSVSQNPMLAEQETQNLHIDLRAFGEAKLESFSRIQTAGKTAYLVLQKVLNLLKNKLEEKLVAANALTSAEEDLSAPDRSLENNNKAVEATKLKEDLDDLLKELAILQSSISQKMETSFNLDEWKETLGITRATNGDSTILSTKSKSILSEAIADLEKAKIAEAHAVQNAGQKVDELEDVKTNLRKAAHENASLSATIDSLRIRWNITKAELESIQDREKIALAEVAAIKGEIKNVKADTTAALAAEGLSKKLISALTGTLQEMSIEADKAKISHKLALEEAHHAKIATRQAKAESVTAECKLQAAYREGEAAKASEAIALEEIKSLSQTRSQNDPDAETIDAEHYDALHKKLEETDKQARGKLAEVMSLLEAEKGAEQELLKQLEEAMADIEASKSTKQEALLQAEAAEAAKVAVEGELRRWRAENRQRRCADAAAGISTPSPTYSGRLLTPQTPDMKTSKTDHFAQVYQLSLPPPPEKDYSVKIKHAMVKKTNFFVRILSFFSFKKRLVKA